MKGRVRKKVFLLAICGALISAYLFHLHIQVKAQRQHAPAVCDINQNFNCTKVVHSAYSELFGVPIAAIGLVFYLFLCLCSLGARKHDDSIEVRRLLDLLLVFALLTIPPTLYLLWVSVFILGTVCPFCGLLYLVNVLLCAVTLWTSERSKGLLPSVAAGLRELVALFVSGGVLGRVTTVWLALLLFVVASSALPYILANRYQEQATGTRPSIEQAFAEWRQLPQQEALSRPTNDDMGPDYSLGPADAPHTLLEFSDFQCPYCRRASGYLKHLVQVFDGQLRLVFKNYPLDAQCNDAIEGAFHELSCQAAIMARCAGRQSPQAFWKMHDALFGMEFWDLEALLALPDDTDLLGDRILSCMGEEAENTKVRADIALGNSVGVSGTPSLYLDGRRIDLGKLKLSDLEPFVRLVLSKSN